MDLETKAFAARGRNGKSALLMARFRAEIAAGDRLPGHRMPSYSELGRLHGVAPLTAERIYAQLEREGLLIRQNGVGVFVREKSSPRTGVIGFSGARPIDSTKKRSAYFGVLVDGIQEAAMEAGYELLLLRPDSEIRWEKMDGVLVGLGYSGEIASRLPIGMPFVSLVMNWEDHPSILSDDVPAMADLTRHLMALGHERIGIFSAGNTDYSRVRYEAYFKALSEVGQQPRPDWRRQLHFGDSTGDFEARGYLKMREWLDSTWKQDAVTAIMAYNDDCAYGVIRAREEAGYSVPEDISVTGFDGTLPYPGQPHLTTALVPLRQIGKTGFASLLQWMDAGKMPRSEKLPAEFLAGQTTGLRKA